jgi:hypothetical protein
MRFSDLWKEKRIASDCKGIRFSDFWKRERTKDEHKQEASRRAEQINELNSHKHVEKQQISITAESQFNKLNSHKPAIMKEQKVRDKNVENKKKILLLFDSVLFATGLKNKLDEKTANIIMYNSYYLRAAMKLIEKKQIDLIITEKYDIEILESVIKAASGSGIKIVLMTGLKSDREYFAGMFDKILDYYLDDKNIKEIKNLLADRGQQENPQENQKME